MDGNRLDGSRPNDLPSDLRLRLTSALAEFPRQTVRLDGRRAAAVAVVVGESAVRAPAGDEPHVNGLVVEQAGPRDAGAFGVAPRFLLTRRTSRLRSHAGQWALPGGRADEGEDAPTAARREVAEEVGLDLGEDAVLGVLDDYPTRSGYVITPVVLWAGAALADTVAHADEVAAVYGVPLADLDVEPRFISIPESDRPVIQLPLLGSLVHAPTGAVLYQFAEVALRGRATRVAEFDQPTFAWR